MLSTLMEAYQVAAGRGLCFTHIRENARRAGQRNVSGARTMKRFMAANSFTLSGVCVVSAHGVTA